MTKRAKEDGSELETDDNNHDGAGQNANTSSVYLYLVDNIECKKGKKPSVLSSGHLKPHDNKLRTADHMH